MKIRREISNSILAFGLSGGLIALLFIVVLFLLNYNPYGKMSLFGMWVPVVIIVFGIKYIKDNYNNYEISFLEGWFYGILIGLVYALSASMFIMMFHFSGGNEALNIHRIELIEMLNKTKPMYIETLKMTEDSFFKLIETNQKTSILDVSIDDFIKKTVGSLIVSLIAAVIMRQHLPKPEKK